MFKPINIFHNYTVYIYFTFSRKHKELLKKYYCIDIRIVFTSFKVKKLFFTEMPYSPAFVGQCSL